MNARLREEHTLIAGTLARSDRAQLRCMAPNLLRYEVEYRVRTAVRNHIGRISVEERSVNVHFILHPAHPTRPPLAVAGCHDLFNTHVADPRMRPRAVELPPALQVLLSVPCFCLGEFHPRRRIADWVIAAYDILRWALINTSSPLNEAAASWARAESREAGRFPLDKRGFFRGPSSNPTRVPPDAGQALTDDSAALRLVSPWREG